MNLGPGEIFAIVLIGLLLFGPDKIPEIMRAAAKGYRELIRLRRQFDSTVDDVKRDLKLDPDLFNADAASPPAASAATSLIRPPQGERQAVGGNPAAVNPAANPLTQEHSDRSLFQTLPIPEEDDYLTAPTPVGADASSAAVAQHSAAAADPEDYLGGAR